MPTATVPVTTGILAVHDDPGMRYWIERVLVAAGYRVVTDSSLTEALYRVRDDATIGLLVADWHLGEEIAGVLVDEVRRRDPAFPVLVVTAQAQRFSQIRQQLPEDVLVVFTPISEEAFLETVRHVWRGDAPRPVAPPGAVARAPAATVLVVDDEEGLRRFAMRALAEAGYAVLGAGNGEEALALLERLPAPVQLVVTDVKMPVMTGRALGEQLARRWPGLPVLYMTGSDSGPAHGLRPLAPLLPKPFLSDALVRAVGALIVR
ncbi:MAG TPA: response regulator [Gemmatimonadales bacterium]|nr:response regulator [Gemmatimonadales bacterium]